MIVEQFGIVLSTECVGFKYRMGNNKQEEIGDTL